MPSHSGDVTQSITLSSLSLAAAGEKTPAATTASKSVSAMVPPPDVCADLSYQLNKS